MNEPHHPDGRRRTAPPLLPPASRPLAWWVEHALMLTGVLLLLWVGGAWLDARAFQWEASRRLAAITPPEPTPVSVDSVTTDSSNDDDDATLMLEPAPDASASKPHAPSPRTVERGVHESRTPRTAHEAHATVAPRAPSHAPAAPRERTASSPRASGTRAEIRRSGLVGRVVLPRLHLSAVIAEGTSGRTLAHAVGHVRSTALPGEPGNVGLTAHRDSYFRPLAKVRTGDLVRLETPDGVFAYRVVRITVVDPRDTRVMRPSRTSMVTLVTCFPFRWVGPAPKRFVVQAQAEPLELRAAR